MAGRDGGGTRAENRVMDLEEYRRLRNRARRHTRRREDADDLLQDVLRAALEAGRFDAPWLEGVMRNQAALTARSAGRRRRREAATGISEEATSFTEPATNAPIDAQALLDRLPPAARRVAVLALHGLGPEEIRWILGLTLAALRQRLTRIRRQLGELPPALRAEALALADVRDPARSLDLQFGLIRRALKAALLGRAGLGTHDADGHLIVIRGRRVVRGSGGLRQDE
jgi:RNA polymerase sigma factor (sigma-70 family)